jgi:hypothetical protein
MEVQGQGSFLRALYNHLHCRRWDMWYSVIEVNGRTKELHNTLRELCVESVGCFSTHSWDG